jgi:NADH-quinone oxidoreductase subunit L
MLILLPWAWLLPLPGLLMTAAGVGRRPGTASLLGPLLVGLAGLSWIFAGGVPAEVRLANWLPFLPDGSLHLRIDGLSAAMLAAVGLVSFCIYVYSLAYMTDEQGRPHPGRRRFFAYLDFFVASMALLVLAGTLAVLLVGWAGVGLASFLLISFYKDDPHYHGEEHPLTAGLKALAANAVGDGALLLAAALVPVGCGALTTLQTAACTAGPGGAGLLAVLLLIAASAKSAQGPLYFWLPSAMAGPTPVSALIHAATMVAAGVYLLVRVYELLALVPGVLVATAWIGVLTALLSALASLQQRNFKRGIAYSTLSQLGYMFAGVGFGAPFAAFFHLLTHAFFKALLFLTAGVVIHTMQGRVDDPEDLEQIRGLQKALPRAMLAFLIGSLSLIGVPLITAGAFSKDGILEAGLQSQPLLGGLLTAGVFLTGLYAGRLFFIVFSGPPNPARPHRPDPLLLWPLAPLALGALLLGYLEYPIPLLSSLLAPVVGHAEPVHLISPVGLAAAALGLAGFGVAYFWSQRAGARARLPITGLPWVKTTADAGQELATQVAALNTGRLSVYVLTSIVGLAVVLLLARTLVP